MYKLIIAALPLFFACGSTTNNTNNKMESGKPVQESIVVKKDSAFTIALPCSAGAGYSWQFLDSSFTKVQFERQDYKSQPGGKDGADGIQTFYFKATVTGDDNINFVYVQPFIKPRPANAKTKAFSIQIINQ